MAKWFSKKEQIYFSDRKTWKERGWRTYDDMVEAHFNTKILDDIMTISVDRVVAKKAEKAAAKLNPQLTIQAMNDCICYWRKDEKRLYDLLNSMESEQAKPEPVPVTKKKTELNNQIRSSVITQQSDYPEEEPELPPTEIENRWAADMLIEDLTEADPMLVPAKKPRRQRATLGRTNEVKFRLTDSELTQFKARVKSTGIKQGDYLRSLALTGEVVIKEENPVTVAVLDELALLRAELGRQGGMLKMIIKPNEGQRELAPEEWQQLIDALRGLEESKQIILQMKERVINDGDC